ncbi:MAG: hypothetical protein QNJ54_37190 [Prochloraceae cyanobacterium]|nr:hypothetical protein [Prochloraceae cyanobacterium]
MGTDASICIEKYEPGNGWKYVGYENDLLGDKFLTRNYALYGILANEEHEYEFIDSNTTKGFKPIASPRGIPKDTDPESDISSESSQDPYGRWHHTWLTLDEILNFSYWDTYHLYECVTSLREYKKNIKKIDDRLVLNLIYQDSEVEEGDGALLNAPFSEEDYNYSVKVKYRLLYKEICSEFYTQLLPKLKEIDDNPNNVRIIVVFW